LSGQQLDDIKGPSRANVLTCRQLPPHPNIAKVLTSFSTLMSEKEEKKLLPHINGEIHFIDHLLPSRVLA
jgi:hypothetical protein